MVSVLSFDREADEQRIIEQSCKDEIALRSDNILRFIRVMAPRELGRELSQEQIIDLIFYEIIDEADIERLKTLRDRESRALVMLLTSPRISPMLYLKPKIAPDSLLLRPFQTEAFMESVRELFDVFFSNEGTLSAQSFVLKSRDSRSLFPFEKISYFEASNKKINLRVGNEEYDFYDSIESISKQVPDYFIRCHRSYIINTKKSRGYVWPTMSLSSSVTSLSLCPEHTVMKLVS